VESTGRGDGFVCLCLGEDIGIFSGNKLFFNRSGIIHNLINGCFRFGNLSGLCRNPLCELQELLK